MPLLLLMRLGMWLSGPLSQASCQGPAQRTGTFYPCFPAAFGCGGHTQGMCWVDTWADKETLEILFSLCKDEFRILWGWSWTLSRKFGSCNVSPHLERQRLLFSLGFKNLIAKPYMNDSSRKVLKLYSYWFHPNFSTVFRTVWSGKINFLKQTSAVSVSL